MGVSSSLTELNLELPIGKNLYFASDFHLGSPNKEESLKREKAIINWLEHVSKDASAIFLVGDLFDFWFDYKHAVPKGFYRFQSKIAELSDLGIAIHFFTGNHDLWMFDYFKEELNVIIHKNPISLSVDNHMLFIGHGDGLGPGDLKYKFFKRLFTNPFCQWLFRWMHPDWGIPLAQYWSKKSRIKSLQSSEEFLEEKEPLYLFAKKIESQTHHDYYIFGHRHLAYERSISNVSTYLNLGDWFKEGSYIVFNGKNAQLKKVTF